MTNFKYLPLSKKKKKLDITSKPNEGSATQDISLGRYTILEEPKTLYRLDSRPPEVILEQGFTGTNQQWGTSLFSKDTVFAAGSLESVEKFIKEIRMAKNKKQGSGFSQKTASRLYPDTMYLYRIFTGDLKTLSLKKNFLLNEQSLVRRLVLQNYPKVTLSTYQKYYDYMKRVMETDENQVQGPIPGSQITFISDITFL